MRVSNSQSVAANLSGIASAVLISLAPSPASAAVIGFLGNFDVINDTGKTAHGFEIELEGLHASDITDTFGGPGRGFPTGRGFGPGSVERYGSPTIVEYTNGAVFGTKVIYQGLFNGSAWDYGTPSGSFMTPGDNCWSGGGLGYNATTPCDHFGVGTTKNASKTTYSWLTETAPNSGILNNGVVNLPAPVWNVLPAPPPPAGQPPAPPVVAAVVQAPAPIQAPEKPEPQWGDALWVKVFTTELEDTPKLEDLVGGNAAINNMHTETEWQLLQKDPGNPLSGVLESGYGVPVGPKAASILRRYEFYDFGGVYDPEDHHAILEGNDSNPLGADVGHYLGAQNGAVNLNGNLAAVPEPKTLALILAGLAAMGFLIRRKQGV
ncbi:PEP-CTERM sorting domain-containing protein [Paucibacter sp. KCTC 42545]|uniref:PEP-CTERM sorting domain-containing protein n=1 Tax=Paucibacter sp. KCTC 42545 TaxID=1768242 RepID=UPI000733A41C|nr:PEP-CTERM sorting domain-containing protein [Paucibacter sp. KCTC 42545]ALT76708.1 pyruvate-binding protein [Paucibacter sp. KCTC 42545]